MNLYLDYSAIFEPSCLPHLSRPRIVDDIRHNIYPPYTSANLSNIANSTGFVHLNVSLTRESLLSKDKRHILSLCTDVPQMLAEKSTLHTCTFVDSTLDTNIQRHSLIVRYDIQLLPAFKEKVAALKKQRGCALNIILHGGDTNTDRVYSRDDGRVDMCTFMTHFAPYGVPFYRINEHVMFVCNLYTFAIEIHHSHDGIIECLYSEIHKDAMPVIRGDDRVKTFAIYTNKFGRYVDERDICDTVKTAAVMKCSRGQVETMLLEILDRLFVRGDNGCWVNTGDKSRIAELYCLTNSIKSLADIAENHHNCKFISTKSCLYIKCVRPSHHVLTIK